MSASVKLKALIPRGKLVDFPRLDRELKDALNHALAIVRDDYRNTTRTWTRQPRWRIEKARAKGFSLEGRVYTDSEIYAYVDLGTTPHVIVPRRASMLRFRARYRAKTRPRIVGSRAGGPRGDVVWAKRVMHPGTAAREFSKTIAKRRQRNLRTLARVAIGRSIKSRPPGSIAA